MDPITIIMFALIAVMIFFMFRNGKKRKQAMEELQNGLQPGAEVMLGSGIFGTVDSVDDEANKVTLLSGTSTLVVHRNAITQIVPAETPDAASGALAPDDDPEFGERVAQSEPAAADDAPAEPAAEPVEDADSSEPTESDDSGESGTKA